jgi:hypothetical protein
MNHKQFIAFSYFLIIVGIAATINGLNDFKWTILGLVAIFMWLVFLLSDKYSDKRVVILKSVLIYPLLAGLILGGGIWVYSRTSQKDQINYSLPYTEQAKLNGRASLSLGNFSGNIYNGSNWIVTKWIFILKLAKKTAL